MRSGHKTKAQFHKKQQDMPDCLPAVLLLNNGQFFYAWDDDIPDAAPSSSCFICVRIPLMSVSCWLRQS